MATETGSTQRGRGNSPVRFILRLLIGAMVLLSGARLADAQEDSGVIVFRGVNVIDGVSSQPVRNATVIVRDGKIASIATGQAEVPAGAQVFDLPGYWMLPGFVDAHVHIGNLATARTALNSGSTTVRSLGVDHFVDVGLRELHRSGSAELPDVIAAGYHVRRQPSEAFFLNFPDQRDLMQGVSGAEKVRRMVRALVERGVDVIKVNATERAGLPDTDPRERMFSDEDLAAIVDEAMKAGRPVAAHAHGDEGANGAVRAGVRTIEHGTYLSDATLALMRERGTCLVPTVATVSDLIDVGGDYDNSILSLRGRAMLPRIREVTAKAWKMGIKVVAGTDTGYGPSSRRRMADEILVLIDLGMPAMDAIKSATSVSAECLGIEKRTGSIRAGLEADLIVLDRDPLAEPTALHDFVLVVNNGRVVVNRLAR